MCHCRSLSCRRFALFATLQPDPSHPFSRTTLLPYRFTRTKPTSDTRAIPTISAPDSPDSLEPPRLVIRSRTTNHRPCLDSAFDVGRPPRSARSTVHPLPFEQMDVLATNQHLRSHRRCNLSGIHIPCWSSLFTPLPSVWTAVALLA